ncbi:ATP synthase F0 subunit B [Streptomyces marokkonensis]|uniref:ATP synthase F0 subunit B n=1 Tax=Streptomyces marokkonensis TaxID=324855 RepID=A0ABW6Q8N3_9ACTN
MDVQKKLDEIVAAVSGARSMPMSASCVVNRAELLSMLDEVRAALPDSLAQAQELIGGREQMVEQARQEAERIIESAHAQRGSLISDTEIARRSQSEADRILDEARKEAEEIRAEADDYVDSKLANFEVVLTKTLGSVGRGREKLLGTGPGLDEQGYEDEDAPERSHDPETLRRTADEYVDVKLGAFEAVLAKTLEAVGRGRQKLHGRIASDDLGALADDLTTVQHTSDADYLADLATVADQAPSRQPEPQPQQPYTQPEPAYGYAQQQDPYGGYQQQYGGGQDQYSPDSGYAPAGVAPIQQADPYAGYQGYDAQQQAYDPNQAQQPRQQAQQGYALDETSLFDTSMITPEQLRAYERERGL